jgi:hypothetical protein
MSMFENLKNFKYPDLTNGIGEISSSMNFKTVETKLLPLETGLSRLLLLIAKITNISSKLFPILPIISAVVDVLTLLALPILIILVPFFPRRGFGIDFAKKLYNYFYLAYSIILLLLLFFLANPVLENFTNTNTNTTSIGTSSNVDMFINNALAFYNKIVNILIIPIILNEVIFLSLLLFIISFIMFIIPMSLARTYYGVHCKYGQEIIPSKWARIGDIIMHITLIVFLILYCFLKIIDNLGLDKILPKTLLLNTRRVFVIAVVYYVVKQLFSLCEYIISNNILSLSKWRESKAKCETEEEKKKDKTARNIFIRVLNIILVIAIWVVLVTILALRIYAAVVSFPLISKGFNILEVGSKAVLFLFSGNLSLSKVEDKIKSLTKEITDMVTLIPGGVPIKIPDVISIGKKKLEEELSKQPNLSIQDMFPGLSIDNNGVGNILKDSLPKAVPDPITLKDSLSNAVPDPVTLQDSLPKAVPDPIKLLNSLPKAVPDPIKLLNSLPKAVPDPIKLLNKAKQNATPVLTKL